MIEFELIGAQLGVGTATLGTTAASQPLNVIIIEVRGIQPGENEEEVHLTLALGSDQARSLIDLLTPLSATMPTPYEQISASNNHHKETE